MFENIANDHGLKLRTQGIKEDKNSSLEKINQEEKKMNTKVKWTDKGKDQ